MGFRLLTLPVAPAKSHWQFASGFFAAALSYTEWWYQMQDGSESLLAEKGTTEPSPWRAAAYGFL